MTTDNTQPTTPRRGRPEIGPKVEFRIPQATYDRFTEGLKSINSAAGKLTTQTDYLRTVFEDGLNAAPVNTFDLDSRPDVSTVEQYLDDAHSCGIEVFSDGHTYWIASFETNDVIAQTPEPHQAAALTAGALIDYTRIMASDLRELDEDEQDGVAYPELVRTGFDILQDLPAQAEWLRSRAANLRHASAK